MHATSPAKAGIYDCTWEMDDDEGQKLERRFYNYWDGTRWHHGLQNLRLMKIVVALRVTIPIENCDGWKLLAWKGK